MPLCNEFGFDGSIIGVGRAHQYVSLTVGNDRIVVDACINNDLARVKMKNNTNSFISNNRCFKADDLVDIDRRLGYIEKDYYGIKLIEEKDRFYREQEDSIRLYGYNDDFYINLMYRIKELVEEIPDVKLFSDTEFVINYLLKKLSGGKNDNIVKCYDLIKPADDYFDVTRIYKLDLYNDRCYFNLEETDGKAYLYEITESDALKKLRLKK